MSFHSQIHISLNLEFKLLKNNQTGFNLVSAEGRKEGKKVGREEGGKEGR